MKFLIKIDRKTVKKNPNAGSTRDILPGIRTTEFEYRGEKLPIYLKDKVNCYITGMRVVGNNIVILFGTIIEPISSKIIKEAVKDKRLSISMHQDTITVDHFPEPDYFYEYRKTKVQCDKCGEWFDHNELQSDDFMDCYSDRICPLCKEWDCCQLKYESL